MSTLTDFYTELGNKQRDARVRRFFHDQHGRRWFAWADKQIRGIYKKWMA